MIPGNAVLGAAPTLDHVNPVLDVDRHLGLAARTLVGSKNLVVIRTGRRVLNSRLVDGVIALLAHADLGMGCRGAPDKDHRAQYDGGKTKDRCSAVHGIS